MLDTRSIRTSVRVPPDHPERHQALLDMVTNSLRKAERLAAELRRKNTRLVVAGISSSALCALFAGITAARGPLIGTGPDGWRLACTISAVLAFGTTLCIGLSQQLGISDRLSTANQCVGRLRSLGVTITTSSRRWEDVTNEYAEIEQTFPEYCEPPPWPLPAPSPLPPWPPPPQLPDPP